jgi:bifunctional DNA-binding transcriptional regulator/antitoxin component of YhaV-PrlF toxin-antitoxin module
MQAKGKTRGKPIKFKKVLNVSEEVWREIMRMKIEGGYRTVDDVLRDLLGLASLQRTAYYAETRDTKRAGLTLSVLPSRKVVEESEALRQELRGGGVAAPRKVVEESERKKSVERLPYEAKVYINNQVLIPAELVRALGLQNARVACITLEYKGVEIVFNAELLRTRHTDSRQFTIPMSIREKYGIAPGAGVKVKKIEVIS